jgi:branched-chain amino acid transport system ATP-binding protein
VSGDGALEVRGLRVSYGGIRAVHGVDFEVPAGELVTLVGANGAGKTSILRSLSGLVPWEGEIRFDGVSLKGRPAHTLVGMGIAHVPEGRGIFGNLTVRENLELATWQRRDRRALPGDLKAVLARFPRLEERYTQPAGTLSGGEQQMLAVGRALMSKARLLLLDEPSMGMAPRLVQELFGIIGGLRETGVGILLVEQNARMALRLAARAHVLETGRVVLSGEGAKLLEDPRVTQAYLGQT